MSETIHGADRAPDIQTYNYLAIVILVMGVILRLMGLDKGIWLDEYLSIDIVTSHHSLHELRTPPLYFLLLGLWSNVGTGELFLRLLSVAFGVGTMAITMLWLRPYSALASLVSGLIVATMPILLRYSHEIRAHSLLLFTTALAFFFASRVIARPDRMPAYVGLAVSLSAAAATHLVGIMVWPAILVYLLFPVANLRRVAWKKLIVALAVPVGVFAYIYFIFLWRIPDRAEWWMPAFSLELAASMARIVLSVSSLFQPVGLLANHSPTLALALDYGLKAALVAYALCLILFGNWRRSWPFLLAALVFWLQLVAYSVWVIPVFWYRTVLSGLVPLIGYLGLQTATIRVPKIRWAALATLALVLLCFAASWISVESRSPVEQWKQAAQLLESERQSGDLVVVYPDYVAGLIQFYAPDLPANDLLAIQLGTPIAEIEAAIDRRLRPVVDKETSPTIFLVVRSDVGYEQDLATREGLLDHLDARFGPPAAAQKLGIVSIAQYR